MNTYFSGTFTESPPNINWVVEGVSMIQVGQEVFWKCLQNSKNKRTKDIYIFSFPHFEHCFTKWENRYCLIKSLCVKRANQFGKKSYWSWIGDELLRLNWTVGHMVCLHRTWSGRTLLAWKAAAMGFEKWDRCFQVLPWCSCRLAVLLPSPACSVCGKLEATPMGFPNLS